MLIFGFLFQGTHTMSSRRSSLRFLPLVAGACVAALLSARPAAAASLLDQLGPDRPLKVCLTGDYKPFSFLQPDGAFEGLDVDLVSRLAESLHAPVEWVKTSWPTLMSDFGSGRCDMVAGGVSVTLERQKHAGFSEHYLVDGKSAIARCADRARFPDLAAIDRPDVRVIVNPGGTNDRFAKAYLTHANVRVYPDNVTIFNEIVAGHADVMVTDTSETYLQAKLHPELCPVNPDQPFQYGEKALLLPRDDPAFKAYVDQWLHLAQATGELGRVEAHWLH